MIKSKSELFDILKKRRYWKRVRIHWTAGRVLRNFPSHNAITVLNLKDETCIPISLSNGTVVDMTTITTATTTTTESSSIFTEVTIEQSVTNTTPTTMLQESKENEDSESIYFCHFSFFVIIERIISKIDLN